MLSGEQMASKDAQPKTSDQWDADKKQKAINLLNNDDWKDAIGNAPSRPLQRGETINSPVILTGNPDSIDPHRT